jgi:hypothetical protein
MDQSNQRPRNDRATQINRRDNVFDSKMPQAIASTPRTSCARSAVLVEREIGLPAFLTDQFLEFK